MTTAIEKIPLPGLSAAEMSEAFSEMSEPAYRGAQVYLWVHHHQATGFEEMSNLPKRFREALAERFSLSTLRLATRRISSDGTRKYLWEIPSGHQIESVFIPETRRTTVCISSQVGCALGCTFCATAKMGFLKNLTPGEIVEQVMRIQQDTGEKITNVVFMGMGEPFLNYQRVIRASQILSDPQGLAISARKITISTVGVVPRIYQFTDEQQPFSLAISLHAPNQELRRRLMPIAEKFDLQTLMASARYYPSQQKSRRITFEYVLLKGINDSPETARELISLLGSLRCKLNMIPYNDTGLGYQEPQALHLSELARTLEKAPFAITIRKNRGTDIAAACGQLYTEHQLSNARFLATPDG